MTPLDLFIQGAPLAALAPDTEAALREELREGREARAEMVRMMATWDALCELLGHMSRQAGQEAQARLDAWHEDAWIHGYTIGEGSALVRLSTAMAHVTNAARLRETGGVKEAGE